MSVHLLHETVLKSLKKNNNEVSSETRWMQTGGTLPSMKWFLLSLSIHIYTQINAHTHTHMRVLAMYHVLQRSTGDH